MAKLSDLGDSSWRTLTNRSDGATGWPGSRNVPTPLTQLSFSNFSFEDSMLCWFLGRRLSLLRNFFSAGFSSGDSSELSNGEEPRETSSSALRNGSGNED